MPQGAAEAILEEQRRKKGVGEEVYWLTLKEESWKNTTTIQITIGTREKLRSMKKHDNESWEDVIKRLIEYQKDN